MPVIIILASLAVLLLALLCIPLNLVIDTDVYGKPEFRMKISWFFGLVHREISGAGEKPAGEKKAAKDKKKRKRGDAGVIFRILKTEGLLKRFKRLVKDLLSVFKFRDMIADFTVGLGNPADTGLLFAVVGPVTALFGNSRFHQLRIRPSFSDDAVLEGYSHGTVKLRPISLIPPVMKFAFSTTTIKMAGTLISSKWKRKK